MEELYRKAEFDTPEIRFDESSGILSFTGRSLPENTLKFYNPIFDWIEKKENVVPRLKEIHFLFKYFNSATSKILLELLKRVVLYKNAGHQITIKWYYAAVDEEMKDEGIYFSKMVELPFEFFQVDKII